MKRFDIRPLMAAALCVVGLGAPSLEAQSLQGTYRLEYMGTPMTLILQVQEDDSVVGRLFNTSLSLDVDGRQGVDEEGDVTIEGSLTASTGPGGTFEFFEDEDEEYGLLLVPNDASGRPLSDAAEILYATRISTQAILTDQGGAGRQPGAEGSGSDHPIVGIWTTQVILNSEVGSIATEIGMQIGADGTMLDLGSRSVGMGMEIPWEGGGTRVYYRVQGDILQISQDRNQWAPFVRFRFRRGGDLVFNYLQDGSQQTWSRRN